jgi:hypothetical protein
VMVCVVPPAAKLTVPEGKAPPTKSAAADTGRPAISPASSPWILKPSLPVRPDRRIVPGRGPAMLDAPHAAAPPGGAVSNIVVTGIPPGSPPGAGCGSGRGVGAHGEHAADRVGLEAERQAAGSARPPKVRFSPRGRERPITTKQPAARSAGMTVPRGVVMGTARAPRVGFLARGHPRKPQHRRSCDRENRGRAQSRRCGNCTIG